MKTVALFLLLFSAKIVTAQPFNIGITAGGLNYSFRQQPSFAGISYYSLGLCGQYIFKDSGAWGIEANASYYPSGQNNNTGYWNPYKGFSTADYLCLNVWRKHKGLMLQLKAGFFYSLYGASSGLSSPDYGPSVGAFLGIFKISKKSYLGIDINYMCGLQSYFIPGDVVSHTFIQGGSSDITNANLLLKYIIKI